MEIITKRLILRPFRESDSEGLFDYLRAPVPNCFQDMKLESLDQARQEAKRRSESKDDTMFAVCLKDGGELIGELFAGGPSKESGAEFCDTYSPCWQFNPKYFDKGYATEAAEAYFDYLFGVKNARRLYAYTETDNISSQKLCKRLGMRLEAHYVEFVSFVKNPDGTPKYEDTLEYAILKREWESRQRKGGV